MFYNSYNIGASVSTKVTQNDDQYRKRGRADDTSRHTVNSMLSLNRTVKYINMTSVALYKPVIPFYVRSNQMICLTSDTRTAYTVDLT